MPHREEQPQAALQSSPGVYESRGLLPKAKEAESSPSRIFGRVWWDFRARGHALGRRGFVGSVGTGAVVGYFAGFFFGESSPAGGCV